jgi:acyl carrier protein
VFYRALRRRGLLYGPAFQGIESLRRRDGEAIGRLAPAPRDLGAYGVHPARLDAGFQLLLATLPEGEGSRLHLPVELGELHLSGPLAAASWAHARLRGAATGQGTTEETVEGDVTLLDEAGNPVLEARGLRLRRGARDSRAELAGWLYELRWEPAPRPAAAAVTGPGLWLLFADAGGIADGLRTLLEESGESCLLVAPAASYGRLGPRRVGIDPASPQDFIRLLGETGGEPPLRGVVHLWSLETPPADELTPETLERARTRGCVSVLHLVQALARLDGAAPRLWLVTDRAQAVEGAAAPAQAPLLGLGRVIAAEHPDLGCVRIDIDAREAPCGALFEELRGGGLEDEVALRGGRRRVARLERREPVEGAEGDGASFRGDATYLITGGLGGLGLSIARWMVERGARNLVLVGRRGPSEEARAAIAAIEALGARVVAAHADVASSRDLARLLAGIEGTLPPLRGVLHAAGLLDDGILLELTAERFRTVMAPKVEGAWNLHRLTAGLPLDFFVLFSSAAAVLGTRGQGNYAAANAFLDALAWHRRSLGLPAQSIAWGAWAGVGLAAAREERGRRLAERGLGSFLPEQGHAALGLLLRDTAAVQVAVMDVDWALWAQYEPSVRFAARLARLAVEEEASEAEEPGAEAAPEVDFRSAADPAERQRLIEARLRQEAAAVLRLPSAQIDDLRSLTQLGLDSLMALELKGRIDARLGASVQVTRLLKGLSFKQLVEQVSEQLGEMDMPVPVSGGAGWEEIEL